MSWSQTGIPRRHASLEESPETKGQGEGGKKGEGANRVSVCETETIGGGGSKRSRTFPWALPPSVVYFRGRVCNTWGYSQLCFTLWVHVRVCYVCSVGATTIWAQKPLGLEVHYQEQETSGF